MSKAKRELKKAIEVYYLNKYPIEIQTNHLRQNQIHDFKIFLIS